MSESQSGMMAAPSPTLHSRLYPPPTTMCVSVTRSSHVSRTMSTSSKNRAAKSCTSRARNPQVNCLACIVLSAVSAITYSLLS